MVSQDSESTNFPPCPPPEGITMILKCFSSVIPRIAPFTFEGSPLEEGQYTQVNCLAAAGDLPISFSWLLNDRNLDFDAEISISKAGKRSSMLTIESVSYRTSGNYSCIARNGAGETTYTTELMVNGYYFF